MSPINLSFIPGVDECRGAVKIVFGVAGDSPGEDIRHNYYRCIVFELNLIRSINRTKNEYK